MPEITLEFSRGSETWELDCSYHHEPADRDSGVPFGYVMLDTASIYNPNAHHWQPFALAEAEWSALQERIENLDWAEP